MSARTRMFHRYSPMSRETEDIRRLAREIFRVLVPPSIPMTPTILVDYGWSILPECATMMPYYSRSRDGLELNIYQQGQFIRRRIVLDFWAFSVVDVISFSVIFPHFQLQDNRSIPWVTCSTLYYHQPNTALLLCIIITLYHAGLVSESVRSPWKVFAGAMGAAVVIATPEQNTSWQSHWWRYRKAQTEKPSDRDLSLGSWNRVLEARTVKVSNTPQPSRVDQAV